MGNAPGADRTSPRAQAAVLAHSDRSEPQIRARSAGVGSAQQDVRTCHDEAPALHEARRPARNLAFAASSAT